MSSERGLRSGSTEAAERFRCVDAVFDAALDLPSGEQLDYIARACGADEAMRAEVLELLRAFGESDGFLESPAVRVAAMLPAPAPPRVPACLGAFRVVREIGRGGMGTVYLGERADGQFEQRVALKLIQRTTPGVVRRFLTERRILARLEHPAIARLIDGGITSEGLPYFAMELVEGVPIDQYCAQRRASFEERLQLFLSVCDAMNYAHRHLVIHRDLKPSNILVTEAGQVKLLDFGIATLLDDAAGADATRTELLALTPEFAAPEQVLGRPVSTATDVYSLGVLLYMLLTDARPYDVRGQPLPQIQRLICEEDPPPPSDRVRAQWRGRVRADLDLIVMKALQKDPVQRYASVQELSDDVRRFLTGHPVHARRPTTAYRALRFARRHRWSLAAAAAFLVLLAAYAVTVTIQQARVQRALDEARTGSLRAEQVTEFMLGLFQASEQGQAFSDTVTAHQLLERGTARARELSGQPEVQAQMLDAVGQLHMQLGEFERARSMFEEALAARRSVLPPEHVDVATSMANVAAAAHSTGDAATAQRLRGTALDIRRRELGNSHPATLEMMYWYAHSLHESGGREAAERLFDEWIAAVAARPADVTATRAQEFARLGQLLVFRGDYPRAEQLLTEALRIRRTLFGERHVTVARSLGSLGALHMAAGRLAEAERLQREAVALLRSLYPEGHPDLAAGLRDHAVTLHRLERWDEAERLYVEQLALARRFFGTDHIYYATSVEDLGILYHRQRRYADAQPFVREAYDRYTSIAGDKSLLTKRAQVLLGDILRAQGDLAAAEPLLLDGLTALEARSVPGFDFARRAALRALAELNESRGRMAEAQKYRAQLASVK